MNKRVPLVLGNWKMNLNHLEAIALTQKIAYSLAPEVIGAVEVAVLPPFVDLRSVQTLVDGERLALGYGAQDVSPFPSGAYTGDISAGMLAALGCTYVLTGHSERRRYHGETDSEVNGKVKAAYGAGLVPVLCVGESLDVRESGGHLAHNLRQLKAGLDGLAAASVQTLVMAYEPIWAIGTGEVATPEDAQEMCAELRAKVGDLYGADLATAARILYGGSVKSDNAAGLFGESDVDGALVGGASLDAADFAGICRAAAGQTVAR
ncbi:MAG TPA: triose-phosphate isomerase [Jatrophihabitantaceae bacterium]|nr:triose-phosphate isomerase [Jatrophihabitantaceae bacterium]